MTINHFQGKLQLDMSESFQKKCEEIKKKFAELSKEARYLKLIEMGRSLKPFDEQYKTPDRIIQGCQSLLYLKTHAENGNLFFEAHADALISSGLAALLIAVYSGESAETILTQAPRFIDELGIGSSLSPNRSNGLSNIYLRIKQEALKALCNKK